MHRNLLKVFICCAALGLAACGKAPEEVLQEARALHAGGDRQGAVLQIKSLLQESPEDAPARLFLGQLHLEAGDFAGAEKELRRAQDGNADPTQVLPALAKALLMQGEAKKVLAEIDPARITDPVAVARVLAARGTAHLVLRQKEEAQAAFDKALATRPGSPEALVGRARVFASERNLVAALAEVDKALHGDAKDAEALMLRGDLLRASNKPAEAEEAYRQLVAAHPQHVTGLLALVSITAASNRLDDAGNHLAAVRKAAPGNPMAAYFQGLIAFRKGDYKAARDAIGAVLKVAPNHLPSVLLGGAIEFALGSQELAQTRLRYVLERAPGNVYARRVLAASYTRAGQTQKALETLEPAIKSGTKDPALLALAGEAYMQMNDYARAQALFEQAAALDPKNARMRTGLGLSRLAAGDVEAATADLESASQLGTDRNQADVLLVATHLQRRQFDQALKAAQALVAKRPESPVGHNLVAAAYLGKRDEQAARAALMKALEVDPAYVPAATNLAQLDLRKGDKAAARKWLESIVARDRKNVQALIALAQLGGPLGASGEEIEKWLEAARAADPNVIQPVVLLTQHLMQRGQSKRAFELLDKAMAASPDSRELMEIAGQAQLAAGEKNRALGTLGKLATHYPSASSYYMLARAQVANEDPSGAIKTLRNALEQRETFPEAQILLAELEARSGRIAEARAIAAKLQSQNPRSPIGWVTEGDVLMLANRHGEAAKVYEKGFTLGQSGAILTKLQLALGGDGREQEGIVRTRDWLRRHPEDHATRIFLAERLLRLNRYGAAVAEYEFLATKLPDNVVVLNNLAWAYMRVKDRRAIETAERAVKLSPGNPAVLDTMGWILVEAGQIERGRDILKEASRRAPKSPDIRFHYAQALSRSGNVAAAKEELERLLLDFPTFSESDAATRMLVQLRQG